MPLFESYVRLPIYRIPLPTVTNKWDLAELPYFILADAVTAGVRKASDLDHIVESVYNWTEALLEEADYYLVNDLVEEIHAILVDIYNDHGFMTAIRPPFKLIDCSTRVDVGDRFATVFFQYDTELENDDDL